MNTSAMNRDILVFVLLVFVLLPISMAVPGRNRAGNKHIDDHGNIPGRSRAFEHVNNGNKRNGPPELDLPLKPNFYIKSCPLAESIVRSITWSRVATNRNLAAKLLRLHYHDCFVRGCDASILIDPVGDEDVEKDAVPNRSVSGYDIIDEIKTKLEEVCPETVSCADIVALAARDAVSYQFGKSMWKVFMGRRDGKVSLATEASSKLPSGGSNFTTLQKQFSDNGLGVADLVALSGAHTIGVAHCVVFSRRIFNFTGKGDTDPSLDPEYARQLKEECANPPHNPANTTAEFDPKSSLSFDSHYYVTVEAHQGLLQSDAALLTDTTSASLVKAFQDFDNFMIQFGESMMRMGGIGVLTRENEGEIRKNCRRTN